MVSVQVAYVGMNITSKLALESSMRPLALLHTAIAIMPSVFILK
ncbi:hypothetical protein SLEP1_g50383 [Rubroshorea leprosula]|uniref:Uncharacterized protein n=1 Tax=Rubroshorea leprosula TaxID=152421 RepID=A0AAV5M2Y6_9ROSI|nr:hypothetical protein SLEP1_g50383 [Rubroshorea leprosula]